MTSQSQPPRRLKSDREKIWIRFWTVAMYGLVGLLIVACDGGDDATTDTEVDSAITTTLDAGSTVESNGTTVPSSDGELEPKIDIVELDDDSNYVEALCAIGPEEFFDEPSPLAAYAAVVARVPTDSPREADEKAEIVRRLERAAAADVPDARDVQVVGDILAARCGS